MSVFSFRVRRGQNVPPPIAAVRGSTLFGRTFESLAEAHYRYLWASMLLMMAGMNIQGVSRGVLAYDLTGSALAVGLVSAGFAPPVLIFSVFGGVIADRLDRKRVIQVTQFGMGLTSLFVAVSITTGTITIYHLIAASLAQGGLFSFLMPARQAIIPQLVGRDRIANAVSLNASGMALTTLVSPGVGGLIYGRFGVEAAYYVIVALNFSALAMASGLPRVGRVSVGKGAGRVVSEMKEGFAYITRSPVLISLLALTLGTTVLAMPFRSLVPVFVDDVFNRGAEAVGLLLSMGGVGALAGSLFFAGLRPGQPRGFVLIGSTILSGVALILMTVAPFYEVAAAIMILVGLGDAGRRALNSSLIMEQCDDAHRGRVMGVYMMNFGLMPLGVLPLAALAELFGIRQAIGLSAILLTAVGAGYMTANRRVRQL